MDPDGRCRTCNNLHQAIRMGMAYWFNRLIVGGRQAEGYLIPAAQRRAIVNKCQRAIYWRRRAAGMSPTQAKNTTPAIRNAAQRAYMRRWGGNPGKVGSQAWLRRELARSPKHA